MKPKELIHIGKLRKILASAQQVNLLYWDSKANIIELNNVICTSSYFDNDTVNVKFVASNGYRKLRIIKIHGINGKEVII